jgi:hypothetical protein
MLSERQQKAQDLSRAINGMDGATVISPLPLHDDARLRIQVLDSHKDEVFQKLTEWGWDCVLVGTFPRVCFDGMKAANAYEIDLPKPRQPVFDNRIKGEIAGSKERYSAEAEATVKAAWGHR